MIKCQSSTTKGLAFVWVVLVASSITNADQNSVDLDVLYTIFKTVAEPILQSAQVEVSEDDASNEQELLENRIKKQIKNLQFVPNKHMSNEIPAKSSLASSSGSEETVILEIASSQEIQPNRRMGDAKPITDEPLEKYKQLQYKIETMFNKEKISDKTKDLLTNAFEKVINQINRPCISQNKALTPEINRRLLGKLDKAARNTMLKSWKHRFNILIDQNKALTPEINRRLLGKLDKAARNTMLKSWKHRFNILIDQDRNKEDAKEMSDSEENSRFLAKLRDFFFEMHNDFQNRTRRYDLNCNAVNIKKIGRSENKVKEVKHATNSTKKSGPCKFVKICPYELKLFLTDFYAYLFDKINLVFHNYVKMFLVDVSKETSAEKKTFVKVMANVKSLVKKKYNEVISKEKGKVVLDSSIDINVKVANIKKIIDKTVAKLKTLIDYALKDKGSVGELSSKIQSEVKTDIMTNVEIELGEAQDKFKSKMCKSFETCYDKDRKKNPDK